MPGYSSYIGMEEGTSNPFKGVIDEIRIYDQSIISADIQKHYVEGLERHKLVEKQP